MFANFKQVQECFDAMQVQIEELKAEIKALKKQ